MAEQHGLAGWSFDSAGTYSGHAGEPAHSFSRKVGAARGWSLTHRARALRADEADRFDLLVAMDRGHRAHLVKAFGRRDVIAIVAGLALYVVFAFWLHPLLIGVKVAGG
jgi:protein-tyrosine-phosphatase